MPEVKVIPGEIFRDHRGLISSLNAFRFDGVERCYFIHHPDTSVVRAWHAHRYEKKWFCCIKGAFTLALVEIDDWNAPAPQLEPQLFRLTETRSEIICVPEGYANGLKASEPGSVMLVLSGKTYEEALADSWRYDKDNWIDWSQL